MQKILVVDDEIDIRIFLEKMLKKEGYSVIKAQDGLEALERIAKEKPDLVILDVMMPLMDGMEVLQKIKSNPKTRNLPVVMLTVKSSDEDVIKGYQFGADYYIAKPFDASTILAGIEMMLKKETKEEYEISEGNEDN